MSRFTLLAVLSLSVAALAGCDDDSQQRSGLNQRQGRKPPQQTAPGAMPLSDSPCARPEVPIAVTNQQDMSLSALDGEGAYFTYAMQAISPARKDDFRIDLWDIYDDSIASGTTYQLTGMQADWDMCSVCVWLDLQDGKRLMASSGTFTLDDYKHQAVSGNATGTVTNVVFKEVDANGKLVDKGCQLTLPSFQFNALLPDVFGVYSSTPGTGTPSTTPAYY